jgi:hypothetical protein
MSQPAPLFPAFDEWQKMSEQDQDALLDRLETAKQRGSLVKHVLIVLLCSAACAAVGAVLLTMQP